MSADTQKLSDKGERISQLKSLYFDTKDWICHTVPGAYRLWDSYYYIKHRILQSHMIDTRVSKGHWCDKVELIRAGLFELVDDFISRDQEDAFSTVCWDHDEEHQNVKNKIISILYFKHIRLPALEAERDKLWDEHSKQFPITQTWDEKLQLGRFVFAGQDDPISKKQLDDIRLIELQIEEETQANLHEIINIRMWLWT